MANPKQDLAPNETRRIDGLLALALVKEDVATDKWDFLLPRALIKAYAEGH